MGVTIPVSSGAAPTAVTGGTADCDPYHRVGVPCFSLVSEPFSRHTNDGWSPFVRLRRSVECPRLRKNKSLLQCKIRN